MDIDPSLINTAKWIWDSYGKEIIDEANEILKEKWKIFKWPEAEEKYRRRLRDICSTVRVLGNPKPINLDEVFTDVYVLDKPTAFRRFDIQELATKQKDIGQIQNIGEKRLPALRLAMKKKRLFILGKPGAGKTTFLKYLALKTIDKNLPKTPIFISLKEWADSSCDLFDFISQQFEICSFPDPNAFIQQLLIKGKALVLFDGLDEVNIEKNQRSHMITTISNFSKKYENIHICVSCRIAATDYSFDQFTYLEIADFDRRQQDRFISKWFQDSKNNRERFQSEFDKQENEGLRDLARTPLLLTLLCLAFEETLSFPFRRVDLYKESLDALLKKWDSSRGIKRDDVYRKLSPSRKEQMLARIAAMNFENGNYFIAQEKLENQIEEYFRQLPDTENDLPEGEVILKAIESQHGILVERAHAIYSFSHLTFQEYFTARYVVDNAADGAVHRLVRNHFSDDRWREVFLLTASLIDNGDNFINLFLQVLNEVLISNNSSKLIINWASRKDKLITQNEGLVGRLPYLVLLGLIISYSDISELEMPVKNKPKPDFERVMILISSKQGPSLPFPIYFSEDFFLHPFFYDYELVSMIIEEYLHDDIRIYFTKDLTFEEYRSGSYENIIGITDLFELIGIPILPHDIQERVIMTKSDIKALIKFLEALGLFLSCFNLATVSDRKKVEGQLLGILENI